MSGIVAVVRRDGGPVDPRLLRRLVEALAYRGPDEQHATLLGRAGLGHAMLRTTRESAAEHQPLTLDRRVWITADARIDDRATLVDALRAAPGGPGDENRTDPRTLAGAPDAELILRAHYAWGERCVHHLLGDFAFAIWDEPRRRLFCARDPIGVKPFYYATADDALIVGNTLDGIRRHPAISSELDDDAIADFLLFGRSRDTAATVFRDVRRLPAAHTLSWSPEGLRVERYWTLPVDEPIHYRRPADYVERFRELLWAAVDDRLRTDSVAVSMSGGMDSTAVAAAARDLLEQRAEPYDLRAYTTVYDSLIPDTERGYARAAADALSIPIHFTAADNYRPFARWGEPLQRRPEPSGGTFGALGVDVWRRIAARHRVLLTGFGGDPAFCEPSAVSIARRAARQGPGAVLAEIVQFLRTRDCRPPAQPRRRLRRWRERWAGEPKPSLPEWLSSDLVARLGLANGLGQPLYRTALHHPTRPMAYREISDPFWTHLFAGHDPEILRFPIELRHPFFDLRLVRYLLSVPPGLWLRHKALVRAAMKGFLPDVVRRRPKTALGRAGHPLRAAIERFGDDGDGQPVSPRLDRYVDPTRIPGLAGRVDARILSAGARARALDYWLWSLDVRPAGPITREVDCASLQ